MLYSLFRLINYYVVYLGYYSYILMCDITFLKNPTIITTRRKTSLTPFLPRCVTLHMDGPYTKKFCGMFYQLWWSQGSTNICLELSPLLIIWWNQTVNCNWLNSPPLKTWNALPVIGMVQQFWVEWWTVEKLECFASFEWNGPPLKMWNSPVAQK